MAIRNLTGAVATRFGALAGHNGVARHGDETAITK